MNGELASGSRSSEARAAKQRNGSGSAQQRSVLEETGVPASFRQNTRLFNCDAK
jgi:hypothetical protein